LVYFVRLGTALVGWRQVADWKGRLL
jgi:hypothetical protein